jgi:hypothetical protein
MDTITQADIYRKLENAGIAMALSTVYASLALLLVTAIVLPPTYFMNMFAYRSFPMRALIGVYMTVLSIPLFVIMLLGSVPRLFDYPLIPTVEFFSFFGEATSAQKAALFDAAFKPDRCNSITPELADLMAQARALTTQKEYTADLANLETALRTYDEACP